MLSFVLRQCVYLSYINVTYNANIVLHPAKICLVFIKKKTYKAEKLGCDYKSSPNYELAFIQIFMLKSIIET